jgi:hypothetical protein
MERFEIDLIDYNETKFKKINTIAAFLNHYKLVFNDFFTSYVGEGNSFNIINYFKSIEYYHLRDTKFSIKEKNIITDLNYDDTFRVDFIVRFNDTYLYIQGSIIYFNDTENNKQYRLWVD